MLHGKRSLRLQVEIRYPFIWLSDKKIFLDYLGGPKVITRASCTSGRQNSRSQRDGDMRKI